MKLNIPRASIWPNKSWDTTDPDEMAEAEQWARTLIAESSERPLDGSVSDETPDNGTTTPDKPETDRQTIHRMGLLVGLMNNEIQRLTK